MNGLNAPQLPAAQNLGPDAAFIKESFTGAKGQIVDQTHHPIVANIIDALATFARAAVGVLGQRGVTKRADITRPQN
jgi:hypothetical protein